MSPDHSLAATLAKLKSRLPKWGQGTELCIASAQSLHSRGALVSYRRRLQSDLDDATPNSGATEFSAH
ncbi:hypothetical protein TW80_13290 [Loktanella sp. S4079]|nr:hypothetical protein TW80_13290 [Loktanella sp. S4079]